MGAKSSSPVNHHALHVPMVHVYFLLVFIRFLAALTPFHGYIHPDEYFQSVERIMGRMFDVRHHKAWEFDPNYPMRSFISEAVFSVPIFLMKNYITPDQLMHILTPHNIVRIFRLNCCLLSLIVDYSIYKICVLSGKSWSGVLLVLGSSYCMIVYATRPFSNTLEMIIFSLLLLCISNCIFKKPSEKTVKIKGKGVVKTPNYNSNTAYAFRISFLVVLGIFVRPTFTIFALVPVTFWLLRKNGKKAPKLLHVLERIYALAFTSLVLTIVAIAIDSISYKYDKFKEDTATLNPIVALFKWMEYMVVTPRNFLQYNMRSDNLAEHGLHPRYLHIVVNMQLLLNYLGLCFTFVTCKKFFDALQSFCNRSRPFNLYNMYNLETFLQMCVAAPLLSLSVISHQEPRFLLPLVPPVIFLTYSYVSINSTSQEEIELELTVTKRFLIFLWCTCNAFGVTFYGCWHQSGVLNMIGELKHVYETKEPGTNFHLITTYTYKLPFSLLMLNETSLKDFHIAEMGSISNFSEVVENLRETILKKKVPEDGNLRKNSFFFIFPLRYNEAVEKIMADKAIKTRSLNYVGHFSTELISISRPNYWNITEFSREIVVGLALLEKSNVG